MARLSASVLRDLGVDPVYVPVELPLYSRFRHETVFVSGVPRTRSVLQDLSKQELTAVVLQLTDFRHFRSHDASACTRVRERSGSRVHQVLHRQPLRSGP